MRRLNLKLPQFGRWNACALLLLGTAWTGNLWANQDLDGDGKPDTVTVDTGATWRGATSFALHFSLSSQIVPTTLEFELPAARLRLQYRDVDGDRDDDLVLRDEYNRAIAVLVNQGDGSFLLSTDPGLYGLNAPVRGPSIFNPPERVSRFAWAGTAPQALLPAGERSRLAADEEVEAAVRWLHRNDRAGLPTSRAPPQPLR